MGCNPHVSCHMRTQGPVYLCDHWSQCPPQLEGIEGRWREGDTPYRCQHTTGNYLGNGKCAGKLEVWVGGLYTWAAITGGIRWLCHDDVMAWYCFLHYWPFVRGIQIEINLLVAYHLVQDIAVSIDPSHMKSHNALDWYPTMHHFVTEMCTFMHISVAKLCIVGYRTSALWNLCSRCILFISLQHWMPVNKSSNKLQWLEWMIGYPCRSPIDAHQGSIPVLTWSLTLW